jgi:DNA-binding NarL/FixJ family response regulator
MFAIFACDPNAVGVFIGAPLSAAKTLSPKSRELCQVVAYVALGERNKLVAYRLGLSPARISSVLRRAMRKLGVKSRAALVHKVRPMGVPAAMDDESVA